MQIDALDDETAIGLLMNYKKLAIEIDVENDEENVRRREQENARLNDVMKKGTQADPAAKVAASRSRWKASWRKVLTSKSPSSKP